MKIEAPRGTFDVLPAEQPVRDAIVHAAESAARVYGYGRITTPTFEDTELFARTSGAGSDVVQKEMYTFEDQGERSLTLRPEGTAPVARAYIEHGLHREPQPVKTYYVEPFFRYAAPQKGRFREFWQIGFEGMGSDDPALDAELIQLFAELARRAEVRYTRLELNSIGDRECRPAYVERLRDWLAQHADELDEDTRRKAEVSPLRVFDTKNESVQRALASAPTIGESLCAACAEHFASVRACLDAYGIAYELRPTLVRGLDYYTRTVWEFSNEELGAAQSSICAGGRYDYLIEEIGGPPTPGVGWAAGIERMAMSRNAETPPAVLDVFFAFEDRSRLTEVLPLMAKLRAEGRACDTDYAGRSLKGQLTQAQRLGATTVVIAHERAFTVRRRGREDIEVDRVEDLPL
ncbi:MAG TPA: histidine--tRNA ligase [Gaiellaceae bacterium]